MPFLLNFISHHVHSLQDNHFPGGDDDLYEQNISSKSKSSENGSRNILANFKSCVSLQIILISIQLKFVVPSGKLNLFGLRHPCNVQELEDQMLTARYQIPQIICQNLVQSMCLCVYFFQTKDGAASY